MPSHPLITAQALLDTLLERGIVTPATVVSLLGEKRHAPALNTLEIALVRENVLSKTDLLALKGELSGLPTLTDPNVPVTANLPADVAARAGALILGLTRPTVAMVEDTEENIAAVRAAVRGQDFDICLVTAPQFAELRRAAYAQGTVDTRQAVPDVFTVLDHAIAMRASDVHLKVGVPPVLRVDGSMCPLEFQPLTQKWMLDQVEQLVEPRHREDLETKFSTDLAYTFGTSRFRVNIANDAHGLTMVMRKLPSKIPTFDELKAPMAIRRFAGLERGMVLVTGPTGSGKSTTLAAIINEIISTSSRHVITLEDPIEFRFPADRLSLVNQRELNSSLASFEDGIRDALRQDPDVCLVGELRDSATIKAALTLAETGHLVLGTLHTTNAAATVSRVVNSFPAEEQPAVRAQLALMLKGVVSQTLLPKATTKGRVAAYEILVSTPAIATNLRKVDGANQLRQTMQTSAKEGMCTIESSLAALVNSGIVKKEEAEFRAQDLDEFHRLVDFYSTQ